MHTVLTRAKPGLALAGLVIVLTAGCATRTPSIAHVHVGHAITGARDTPGQVGYLTLGATRANDALAAAEQAIQPNQPVAAVKSAIQVVNSHTNVREDYALAEAVAEASRHVLFAAGSFDSSLNVRNGAQAFKDNIEGVLYRSSLIGRYADDAAASANPTVVHQLAGEIHKLANANVNGEDLNGDGIRNSAPREFGTSQLQGDLEAMVAREDPAYVTVNQWFLFNLIRLPDGNWMFKRSKGSATGPY